MSTPGYGDIETWPPYAGHPGDPRAPSELDPENEIDAILEMAESGYPEESEIVADALNVEHSFTGDREDWDRWFSQMCEAIRARDEERVGRLYLEHIDRYLESEALRRLGETWEDVA